MAHFHIKAGSYSRISRDEDKKNYSTIESQNSSNRSYCMEKFGCLPVEMYEDDNVSGYTMNRPDFRRLRSDIEEGKINTIIVKDLSRIGRHNAYVLMFLEEMKQQKVRIIAISDNYDSFENDEDIIGIKTWYNEMYIKDISRKIKLNLKDRMKRNDYLCAVPFGYTTEKPMLGSIKRKIILADEFCANIVRRIFKLYIEGCGYRRICNILNNEGVITPSQYLKQQKEEKGKIYKKQVTNKWDSTMVMRMLRNDFYIGTLRLGKNTTTSINGKVEKTEESQQYIFEDNHEAIVSKEDFYLVQELIQKRTIHNYRGSGHKHKNLFSGFLFCADCGSYMVSLNKEGKNKSYICGAYNRRGKAGCTTHYILDKKILVGIYKACENTIHFYEEELRKMTISSHSQKKFSSNLESKIEKLKNDAKLINNEIKILINQKIRDMAKNPEFADSINENYDQIEKEKREKLANIEKEIKNIDELLADSNNKKEKLNSSIDIIQNIIEKNEINKKDLEQIIERIIVYEGGVFDIELRTNYKMLLQV